MLIARDCLCEAQGCFLLYVLCSLITFSSLVPIVFSLGCQQSAFITVDYRDFWAFISSLTVPSPFFFVAFPVSVGGEVTCSRTLCAILVHFASSPVDPLCPSSKENLIFRCSDLSSSLLPHLPGLLSTYFPSYSC